MASQNLCQRVSDQEIEREEGQEEKERERERKRWGSWPDPRVTGDEAENKFRETPNLLFYSVFGDVTRLKIPGMQVTRLTASWQAFSIGKSIKSWESRFLLFSHHCPLSEWGPECLPVAGRASRLGNQSSLGSQGFFFSLTIVLFQNEVPIRRSSSNHLS